MNPVLATYLPCAMDFAKELYDAKLLSEEGWKRIEEGNSPKVLSH